MSDEAEVFASYIAAHDWGLRGMKQKTIRQLNFMCPIKTVSEANTREHWAVKYGRKKLQQQEMDAVLHNNLLGRQVEMPCVVRLTRIGPKALDQDNLAGSFKACQDSIARKLGIDDGDTTKVSWIYDQMPVGINQYGVKVSITSV